MLEINVQGQLFGTRVAGPPQYILGRQGSHSDVTSSVQPTFSISQNPDKDQALAALPPVAALSFMKVEPPYHWRPPHFIPQNPGKSTVIPTTASL